MTESEEHVEEQKYRVTVTITTLGNERRVIQLGEVTADGAQSIVRTIDAGFGVVRQSSALMLSDATGVVTYANLDNVAFIEVNVV